MERQRGVKALSLVALIVAVLGLTVAFAAMTQSLTINGTATMDTAKWDIHYEYFTSEEESAGKLAAKTTGHATAANTAVIETGATAISGISMTLTRPGDSVSYDFKVHNAGDINATITTFTKNLIPTCTGTGDDATADASLVCGNLTYSFNYTTGSGNNIVVGNAVAQNDTLNAGETKQLRLTLAYDGTTLPKNDVNLTNMNIETIYTQAD